VIDLGTLSMDTEPQWHRIHLVNKGGGLSERWTATGQGEAIRLHLEEGNLRGAQDVYFKVETAQMKPGSYNKEVTFNAEHGSSDTVRIEFDLVK
jgi:hypothetical protein